MICPRSRLRKSRVTAGVCIFALAVLLAEAPVASMAAAAATPDYILHLPAGPIQNSLSLLSRATGASIGLSGDLPALVTRPVSGRLSVEEALHRLLRDTGFKAIRVGANAFRIIRNPPRLFARSRPRATPALARASQDADAPPPVDIVVTAQKRAQILSKVGMSLTVVSMDGARSGIASPGSREIALATEGLAMTNLGPGRNRQFIRGVADSPFNGPSQATVAVQMDNARVNFDAPDPDLRLIDVDRVELLKGPQGPLYGSGAIGGIYHIVTHAPQVDQASASIRLASEAVQHGGVGGGGEAIVNLPLLDDRLAVRGVGYGFSSPGWIDNIGRNKDANRSHIYGGRLALRWKPAPDWTVDLGGMIQNIDVADSQYVLTSSRNLSRDEPIAESNDNDFRMIHATVEGRIGALRLLSATSYVDHGVDYVQDASARAVLFGLDGLVRFTDNRSYSILNQEIRLSDDRGGWLAGASFMRATDRQAAGVQGQNAQGQADGPSLAVGTLRRLVTEYALFGEWTAQLRERLTATLGARLFRTIAADETTAKKGQRALTIGKTILSPSATLSWALPDGIVYLRYARALRPGGLANNGTTSTRAFDSDQLGTLDLGTRQTRGKLKLAASLYYTVWSGVQSDYLLANGLVGTRNAGRGQIYGLEASGDWALGDSLTIGGGFNVQSAKLTHAMDGLKLTDRRLPIAPNISARLGVTRRFSLGAWDGELAAQGNYIGKARLTFDDDLDREMGEYAILSVDAVLRRAGFSLGARIDNVTDVRGDSFAFGNPFSIRTGSQYTPLRPRTLTLSIGHGW